ncbi:MAG: hypothetical protein ACPL25_00140 [Ignavibacteria bacterium]
MKKKIFTLIFLIFSYNLIFYLQDLLDSELQIYFLGFRLNLFLLVNCGVIYLYRSKIIELKVYLKKIGKFKNWFYAFVIPFIFSGLTIGLVRVLGSYFKFRKPDFLVEFGISSLTDIPIYYLWNLPLLLSIMIVLTLLVGDFKFIKVLGISILLSLSFIFVLPVFSFQKFELRFFSFLPLVFAITFYNLTILKTFQSFWISVFSLLVSIYSFVLIFGSSNTVVIKTFFARMYSDWSGLFLFKNFDNYLINLFYAGWMILFAFLFFIFDKKKTDNV